MSNYLYIDGEQVDLDNEIPMPISYSVGDFKNPENRRRSVSKTITVQGTQRNKRIFASAYNLSLTNEIGSLGFDFNPNAKVGARYLRKGVTIFEGLVRLLNVKIDNGAYSFEIVLFSDIVNIIKQMNDINVSELDWSEYNHELNETNVSNSWDTSVIKTGVVTPNYDTVTGKPLGFGYWYPVIDFAYNNTSNTTINIENLVPYLYVKETFEKCFANIGYTLDSDFLNEDMIKALTWGFGGGEKEMVTPVDAFDRRVEVDFDYNSTTSTRNSLRPTGGIHEGLFTKSYSLRDFSPSLISDSYLQFNIGTGEITCMRTGRYNLNLDFDTLVSYDVTSGTAINNGSNIEVEVRKNGVRVGVNGSGYSISGTPTTYSLNADTVLDLDAGDIVTVSYVVSVKLRSSAFFNYNFSIDLNNSFSLDMTSMQSLYFIGNLIGVNRFIPKMKSGEFVKGIINMFNLYVSEPDDDNIIKIEPLSEFYQGEENWTDLLDHSREINIKPSVNDSAKKFAFKFAKDDDLFNKAYFDANGVRYGDYTYTSDNEYNTKEIVFQLPFAQTIPSEISSGYVIPNITKVDNGGSKQPYKGKARIFFNNGLKPMGGWSLNDGTLHPYTSYPQAHHSYGDIRNPTFDLNFSKPEYVRYFFNNYSNNNLFNKYQRINILEQTSIDGKILKAYFHLESEELLDFRKLVNINGVLYRKNLIDNFDANGYETTKVELYKVLETTEIAIPQPAISTGIPNRANVGLILSPTKVGEGSPVLSGGRDSVLRENNIYYTIYERI
jgi:hypothetical protein